jgi:hypothetical protein
MSWLTLPLLLSERASQIEFTATHEKTAAWIGADETAFMVDQLPAADRAEFPPLLIFLLRRCIRILGHCKFPL